MGKMCACTANLGPSIQHISMDCTLHYLGTGHCMWSEDHSSGEQLSGICSQGTMVLIEASCKNKLLQSSCITPGSQSELPFSKKG